ncbi:tRNA glutamyl-Q(34) synthetase GluQRS [Dokdonella sp.]|uniref:tRNA glutamyl-Q(34) synthetase GluQRS n=1 Tax=Dokdonella sp. TaxID=2291710 RepID=UPI003C43F961
MNRINTEPSGLPLRRGRFAPSPSGRLHFGSLVAALGSWLRARHSGGCWIVRMEDLDRAREIPGASADILSTLAACGLASDETVVFQSQRSHLYAQAFASLQAGGWVYPCHCSRSDLAVFGGIHPAHCVAGSTDGNSPSWRLRVGNEVITFDDAICGRQTQVLAEMVGDFVVRRSDGSYTYQLAVVVDDADQSIDEVVRGADLLDSTPRQLLLQRLLGLGQPAYAHLPLALDELGRKLSKHDQARPVDASDPVPALRSALAFLGQPVPAVLQVEGLLREAVARFDLEKIRYGGPIDVALQKD